MDRNTRQILIIFLGGITIWDTVTTITGTLYIIGDGFINTFLAILFGVMIASLLLLSIPIVRNPKTDIVTLVPKILLGIAICYDLFTSFTGNQRLIANEDSSFGQTIVVLGMTLFVSSSPMAISYLIHEVEVEDWDDDEEDDE